MTQGQIDINTVIKKAISTILSAIFITILFSSLYLSALPYTIKIILLIAASFFIAIVIPFCKYRIESFINRLLFGARHDHQETLSEISNALQTIIDLDKLIIFLIDKLSDALKVEKSVFFLKNKSTDGYTANYLKGLKIDNKDSLDLDSQNYLLAKLKETKDVLTRNRMHKILDKDNYRMLCNELDKFEAEVVVPIIKGNDLLGIMTLSNKSNKDRFRKEDFHLLNIISVHTAAVIENINLYNRLMHSDRQAFLETLASGVSHEMRNRLVAIRTFIDLFPERIDRQHVDPGYWDFRELAVREMDRLTKIIDGLLAYSRSSQKGGEPLNINNVIEEVFLIIQPKLREKEITISKELGLIGSTINGDKGRLLQVFINIMQNGIDAMEKGGRFAVSTNETKDIICVSISDNGKGILKEHLEKIFEPFFTTKHSGTGLGLSIVHRIVRDHNGNIDVSSESGKGTRFNINLKKGAEYAPEDIQSKEGLNYSNIKKEFEKLREH